jgi:hypothetical protein
MGAKIDERVQKEDLKYQCMVKSTECIQKVVSSFSKTNRISDGTDRENSNTDNTDT